MRVRFSPGLQKYKDRNIMFKFIRESREELRKVVWPGRDEVFNSTIVVLGAVIAISLFLFLIDNSFDALFNFLVKLGKGSTGK